MSKPTTAAYRFIDSHAGDLADGRVLDPGATYKLDSTELEHPHNQRLLDEGLLIPIKKEGE